MSAGLIIDASALYLINPYVLPWNEFSSRPEDPIPFFVRDRQRKLDAAVIRAPFSYEPNVQGYYLTINAPLASPPVWDYTLLGGVANVDYAQRNFVGQLNGVLSEGDSLKNVLPNLSYASGPAVLANRFRVNANLYTIPAHVIGTATTSTVASNYLVTRVKIPADFAYTNDAVQYLLVNLIGTKNTICRPNLSGNSPDRNPDLVPTLGGFTNPGSSQLSQQTIGDNSTLTGALAPIPQGKCEQCVPPADPTTEQWYYVEGNSLWFGQRVEPVPIVTDPVTLDIRATVSEIPYAAARTAQPGGPTIYC